MSWTPSFRLYASDGTTLLYTFSYVNTTNAPQSPIKVVEHEGQRGIGGLIIDGGIAMWDLTLRGQVTGANYTEVSNKIEAMENAVDTNTKYIIKFDINETTTYSYRVKRIVPIRYEPSLRNYQQFYEITFRVNSW